MSAPQLQVLQWMETPSEAELGLLAKATKAAGDGATVLELLAERDASRLQIWRAADCLVFTKTILSKGKRSLLVYNLVGRGILREVEKICSDLKVIAKTFECRSISGNVERPGLKMLYEKLGAAPVAVVYELEID